MQSRENSRLQNIALWQWYIWPSMAKRQLCRILGFRVRVYLLYNIIDLSIYSMSIYYSWFFGFRCPPPLSANASGHLPFMNPGFPMPALSFGQRGRASTFHEFWFSDARLTLSGNSGGHLPSMNSGFPMPAPSFSQRKRASTFHESWLSDARPLFQPTQAGIYLSWILVFRCPPSPLPNAGGHLPFMNSIFPMPAHCFSQRRRASTFYESWLSDARSLFQPTQAGIYYSWILAFRCPPLLSGNTGGHRTCPAALIFEDYVIVPSWHRSLSSHWQQKNKKFVRFCTGINPYYFL